jgi:hypothetical protein
MICEREIVGENFGKKRKHVRNNIKKKKKHGKKILGEIVGEKDVGIKFRKIAF